MVSKKFPPGTRVKYDRLISGEPVYAVVPSYDEAYEYDSRYRDSVPRVWADWSKSGRLTYVEENMVSAVGPKRNLPAWW
jgi:hypothetical protein